MTRRVVITGVGVRAPGGNGTKAFWDLLSAGRTATRSISFFDASPFRSRIAGEVDFDAAAEGFGPREIRRMDRATQFAVACTREAVADSGLDLSALDPHRIGVSLGSAVASATSLENEYLVMSDAGKEWEVDPAYLSPHMFDYLSPGVMPAEVAWEVGAEGPVTMVSDGCTSGLDSVGYAVQLIREGTVDTVVAGAADTPISPIVVACFDAIKATTTRNDDPAHASRPFDGTRNGFVLAEGAAMFVLEEYEAAKKRGAHIYAEVGGYATRCNAHHMTGLRKDGREMAEAIRVSLDEARLDGTKIDYINAHGSGTKQNDRHETAAFKRSLGQHAYDVPVSSIKSMVGHSLGAIGSVEIAASLLAIEHNVVPPTANLHTPDPECDLDYVPLTAREQRVDTVLTVGSGFGGFQSAMILHRPEVAAA
ncbi:MULTISPECIES: beta-ketoacyl-[acyl-carrier-protein] synthase family protein [Streptomyces]|jgi:act minimal PKS ketosynthase (KS/KS alpha)|uniref:Beta-ketoacyl-[acyl-carrier-protein] synthase family protein n=2 Tax=Streptomyces TaxID=1883 RepID=A0ABW6Z6I6_9ACTN|nr:MULTISPECIES: beta-ketoacyl-[acyl-carrier-protein] synthase family protein [Streptomyces]MCL3998586.1 beta-ketoacyl-[acyl-carrier-protein] synthase family protein [Streptomyces lavenduligriseus]QIS74311.1 beta-ketoacyl-[acyl-carrier-protein] synthase family protein [Streptomyces sp. DSM 40868]WDM16146.1 beta-ketoacyl-[acyl-carrier-protein] synthase family protein [Streptomyces lavenduligriseus]